MKVRITISSKQATSGCRLLSSTLWLSQ